MTNYKVLYGQAQAKLAIMPTGKFRLNDLVDNPPARLGRQFRDDVVLNNIYPNVRRICADAQSVIYEKY